MSFLIILAALVALVPASTHARHACNEKLPADVTTKHFQGKCYAFITQHYSDYSQASKTCKHYGGSLAIVNSSEINAALTQVLDETIDTHLKFWIGLNDLEMEGVYRWEDGSLMDYDNFEDGRFTLFDRYEDCVAMNYHGIWYLYKCNSSTRKNEAAKHFICEFP